MRWFVGSSSPCPLSWPTWSVPKSPSASASPASVEDSATATVGNSIRRREGRRGRRRSMVGPFFDSTAASYESRGDRYVAFARTVCGGILNAFASAEALLRGLLVDLVHAADFGPRDSVRTGVAHHVALERARGFRQGTRRTKPSNGIVRIAKRRQRLAAQLLHLARTHSSRIH